MWIESQYYKNGRLNTNIIRFKKIIHFFEKKSTVLIKLIKTIANDFWNQKNLYKTSWENQIRLWNV